MSSDLELHELQLNSLIYEGQYARLAEFFFNLHEVVEPTDQQNLKNLAATALQICMFCQQCQTELEWHRKADHQVRLRLSELNEQLDTLLNLILESKSQVESQLPTLSVSVTLLDDQTTSRVREHPSLWQQIRNLFTFEPSSPHTEQQITKVVVNASFPLASENGENLSQLESKDKHLPLQITTEAEMPAPATSDKTNIDAPIENQIETTDELKKPASFSPNRELETSSTVLTEELTQSGETAPSLVVYCLGPLRVYINENPVEQWPGNKGKSIFKYLVCHHEHPTQRDILMDLFWPEADPEASRRNLYQAIYNLRQALRIVKPDFGYVLQEGSSYYLNPNLDLWVDSDAFVRHYQTGQSLDRSGRVRDAIEVFELAEHLYEGEYLPEDRYEDWTIIIRENLNHYYLDILDRLSRFYFDEGEMALCISYCQKILVEDNCREDAHRRLMRSYQKQDQRHLAIRQYHTCVEVLEQELEVPPMRATIALFREVQTKATKLSDTE